MYHQKVAKVQPETAESMTRKLQPQRSTLGTRPLGGSAIERGLFLQNEIGNRAVQRLLRRNSRLTENERQKRDEKEADRASLIVQGTGVSGGNQHRAQLQLSGPTMPGLVQPRLAVGEVNDPLEHGKHTENRQQPAVQSLHHHATATPPTLFRQHGGVVPLTGVRVNHERVTVPPVPALSFSARKTPGNASGVTFSVVGDSATIAAGTTVDNSTGAITVAADQNGGSAHIQADQSATGRTVTFPFNFTAIPSGITSTAASPGGPAGFYGGEFTHTFTSPAGGQPALELSHVNEQFAGSSGTNLTIHGNLGTLTVHVNNPGSPAAGWDLDSSGTMAGPDHVTWSNNVDARPFVANASHPSPSPGLPQELTATQNFRNLTYPPRTYGAAAFASTIHRRAIEDRNNQLKAVTSAGINQEIVENYLGPTVFRGCVATPASIPVASPAPSGATAPAAATSTITVDAEGKPATPAFSVRPPALGCRITHQGELTPGTTPGTVTVRAGNAANFDETTVTLTPQPAAPPRPWAAPATRAFWRFAANRTKSDAR